MKLPEFIGQGRHRAVFRRGTYVLKVPLCVEGEIDNCREARRHRENPAITARTRIVIIEGRPCALAEYLEEVPLDKRVLKENPWIYSVDCQQVGKDRYGRWKAYDFA